MSAELVRLNGWAFGRLAVAVRSSSDGVRFSFFIFHPVLCLASFCTSGRFKEARKVARRMSDCPVVCAGLWSDLLASAFASASEV